MSSVPVLPRLRKFQLDDDWLRQVIRLRPAEEAEKRLVNKNFENILADNYIPREYYHRISVVFRLITDQGQPNAERLNKMVSHLWRHPFPWFESEFMTIVSMRAIRVAFEAKGLLNPEQRFAAEQFGERFLGRVKRISGMAAWAAFVALAVRSRSMLGWVTNKGTRIFPPFGANKFVRR